MKEYEYVSKELWSPVRNKSEILIKKIQSNLKLKFGITFQFELIGSGTEKFITREKNGNKGFDLDYNFYLKKTNKKDPKIIKKYFLETINEINEKSMYENPENNTNSITIKLIDRKSNKIIHKLDFAIFLENEENDYSLLTYNKLNQDYSWSQRKKYYLAKLKTSNLKSNGLWNEVRKEYLRLKNNNQDINKISFSLYLEAVNNIYNKYDWE